MTQKLPRPRVVAGLMVRVETGCGHMYVQLGFWGDGLHEVFATLGHAGGCATCFNESLTRSITAGLRSGVPVDEYIKQLKGTRCPEPHPFPKKEATSSCPDGIAKQLEEFGRMTTGQLVAYITNLEGQEPTDDQLDEKQLDDKAEKAINQLRKERDKLEEPE